MFLVSIVLVLCSTKCQCGLAIWITYLVILASPTGRKLSKHNQSVRILAAVINLLYGCRFTNE